MSYEKQIGTHLANLIVEMVNTLNEEGVSGFQTDHVKNMAEFGKAGKLYQGKAIKAYETSFDKHEHEGQHSAHEHGMNAAREVFVRMKKNNKASANRRFRDDAMSSMGMTKVKGATSGKTYWESVSIENRDPDKDMFHRLATKKENDSPIHKKRGFQTMPDKEGHEKVYKPYGAQGRGFYYTPKG